jgi:5-methylcytosine-specific restriction endonuclease McrA
MMPWAAKRVCTGCGRKINVRRCPHCRAREEAERVPASERYGRGWPELRARVLREARYLCEPCAMKGRFTEAVEVDHIIPALERPDLKLERRNCQAICRECHRVKNAREGRARLERRREFEKARGR